MRGCIVTLGEGLQNEGTNQRTLKNLLAEQNNTGVYIPEVCVPF